MAEEYCPLLREPVNDTCGVCADYNPMHNGLARCGNCLWLWVETTRQLGAAGIYEKLKHRTRTEASPRL